MGFIENIEPLLRSSHSLSLSLYLSPPPLSAPFFVCADSDKRRQVFPDGTCLGRRDHRGACHLLSRRQVRPHVRDHVGCPLVDNTHHPLHLRRPTFLPSYIFDPYDLAIDITPANVRRVLRQRDYLKAVVMAFRCVAGGMLWASVFCLASWGREGTLNIARTISSRLGEGELIQEAVESVPVADVQVMAQSLPTAYVGSLLKFIAVQVEDSRHIGLLRAGGGARRAFSCAGQRRATALPHLCHFPLPRRILHDVVHARSQRPRALHQRARLVRNGQPPRFAEERDIAGEARSKHVLVAMAKVVASCAPPHAVSPSFFHTARLAQPRV